MVVGAGKVVCRGAMLEEMPEMRAGPEVVTTKASKLPAAPTIISLRIGRIVGAEEDPLG